MCVCVSQLDMQRGVHCRLMDNSTSVREAAVELLGRFVLSRPQLIEQYYDMLIERILVSFSVCLYAHLKCYQQNLRNQLKLLVRFFYVFDISNCAD